MASFHIYKKEVSFGLGGSMSFGFSLFLHVFLFFFMNMYTAISNWCFCFMIQTDENGDGYLSIDEMLNHEYTFYGTFFQDDEDYDDEFHEEL